MKRIMCLLVAVTILSTFTLATAADDKWYHKANTSGLSECAVQVVKKIPLGPYDLIIATFNPLTTIDGSGCTVVGGTTSFASRSAAVWYTQGGVTMTPSQFKLNDVVAYWFGDSPEPTMSKGTSGVSTHYSYRWIPASSGTSQWKVAVYHSGNTAYYVGTEILTTSGQSKFAAAGNYFPRHSAESLLSGNTVTSGTTFYATQSIGWGSGLTPYVFVLGNRSKKR